MPKKLIQIASVAVFASMFNMENGFSSDARTCVAKCQEVFDAGKFVISEDQDEKVLKAYRKGENVDPARLKEARLRENELAGSLLNLVTEFSQCKTNCGGNKQFVDQ